MKRLILLSLLFICISCRTDLPTSSLNQIAPLSYCSILHVTDNPQNSFEKKPYLGIRMETVTLEENAIDRCSNFIKIIELVDGSPADKAGFKIDDIILSSNGKSVCRKNNNIFKEFKRFIKMQEINSEITLEILRDGEELSRTASLKERPFQVQDEASHENISICTEHTSLFKRELQTEDNLTLFNGIRSDLNYHTNLVHNYGWLSKKPANPYQ